MIMQMFLHEASLCQFSSYDPYIKQHLSQLKGTLYTSTLMKSTAGTVLRKALCRFPVCSDFKNWLFESLDTLFRFSLMSCFRGQRGLAESQKKELAQAPVLISCADQWNSAAVTRSHNMDISSGALLSSVATPRWRETRSGSFGSTTFPLWRICLSSGSWWRKETLSSFSSSLLLSISVFSPKPSFGLREDAFLNSSYPP